ncbi:MAG: diguanylate cyclase [Candidatus Izemoplasmatales bacterium]
MITRSPLPLFKITKITEGIHIIKPSDPSVSEGVIIKQYGGKFVLFGYLPGTTFIDIVRSVAMVASIDQIEAIILSEVDYPFMTSLSETELMTKSLKVVVNTNEYDGLLENAGKIKLLHLNDIPEGVHLENGTIIMLWPTPFIVSPTSFVAYDKTSKLLYANHLFDYRLENVETDILEAVHAYLSKVVPSSDFLRPVLEFVEGREIEKVITRTGKIIDEKNLKGLIQGLLKRPFYNLPNKNLTSRKEKRLSYLDYANQMIAKLRNFYSDNEIRNVFHDSPLSFDDERLEIRDVNQNDYRAWHQLFDVIYAKKGVTWLGILEPAVKKLQNLYQVEQPAIYKSTAIETERKVVELDSRKQELDKTVSELRSTLSTTIDRLLKDQSTGVYNQLFLEEHLTALIETSVEKGTSFSGIHLLFLNVDNIANINTKYGKDIGDETIINVSFLLKQIIKDTDLLVKRNGPGFIIVCSNSNPETIRSLFGKIQSAVVKADVFVEPTTISGATIGIKEIPADEPAKSMVKSLISQGEARIRRASHLGPNAFVDREGEAEASEKRRILLVEDDPILGKLLDAFFARSEYDVTIALDGKTALEVAANGDFDAFIVAKNISKIDGFSLKNKFNESPDTINTLFFLTLYNKTPETVIRANRLGINYVIQKPLIFPELLGLIERHLQGDNR